MTIETCSTPSLGKPSAPDGVHGSKGKTNGSGKSSSVGANGFMAILACVDEVGTAAGSDAIGILGESRAEAPVDPSVPNLVAALTLFDPLAMGQPADLPKVVPDAAPSLLGDGGLNVGIGEIGSSESPSGALGSLTAKPFSAPGNDKVVAPSGAPVPFDLPVDVVPRGHPKAPKDLSAGQELVATSAGELAQRTDTNGQVDVRKGVPDPVGVGVVATSVANGAMVGTFGLTDRQIGTNRERSVFKSIGHEGTNNTQLVTNGASSPGVSSTTIVAPTAEVYVAEQVSYWISRDVQNAELKLDGIGKEPVEVSISMQGNEAFVMFRTDESQARSVLENASLQLKDLLQREGLVLSGVSVGTTGAGESGGQNQRPRQGWKQGFVSSVEAASASARSDPMRISGRALDLFV